MRFEAPPFGSWQVGLVSCMVAGIGLASPACDDSPLSPSGNANLVLMLEDDVTDDVDQINVYFTSVTAKPAGRPVERLNLELANNPVNLLELDDRATMFATGVVEPGEYEFIQINIDERRSNLVESGERKDLQVPSQEVKVLGRFTVDEDHRTTITLDFDADESLIRRGNGEWLLRPVIVITGNDTSSRR
jgi:Domain of unknown function (DUF4382)